MKIAEHYGKTVEEAKENAMKELGATSEDQVEVEVLDEGSKGVFGWGSKFARVRVKLKEESQDFIEKALRDILRMMKLQGEIDREVHENEYKFNITGLDLGILIGRRGQTLDSLQMLLNLIANKKSQDKVKVTLDVEGYRERRERSLRDLAQRLAEKVRTEKRNVVLEPMMPNERRIIHLALQNNPYVSTYSQGEEPMRKVIIVPKR